MCVSGVIASRLGWECNLGAYWTLRNSSSAQLKGCRPFLPLITPDPLGVATPWGRVCAGQHTSSWSLEPSIPVCIGLRGLLGPRTLVLKLAKCQQTRMVGQPVALTPGCWSEVGVMEVI